jgi:hypothetical protein
VTADLDVPGETSRQLRVFLVWFFSLALAVVLGSAARPRVAIGQEGGAAGGAEVTRSRVARLQIAGLVGLLLPAALTWAVTRWHRRGGGHARGIVVDVTADGELRLWGRGYGSRVSLASADVRERLVDVYAGRLGAWRQRRLRVRAAGVPMGGRAAEIELATAAWREDADEGLKVEGGEGDCVELERDDYVLVRAAVLEAARGEAAPA